MFFVIDKSKIVSYVIAICTVVILFVAATGLNSAPSNENSVLTSSNVVEVNTLNSIEKNYISILFSSILLKFNNFLKNI